MSDNPFAAYNITTPRQYSESLKKYCQTSGGRNAASYAPFKRQVDFWYTAFLLAIHRELEPEKNTDGVNMTQAHILEPYRVSHIQLAHLGTHEDIELLAQHKVVFDWACGTANAGIPHLLQILSDTSDTPLNNLLDELESSV